PIRIDRRFARENRIAGRSDHSLLLSVRSHARDIWIGDDASVAHLCDDDDCDAGCSHSISETQGKTERSRMVAPNDDRKYDLDSWVRRHPCLLACEEERSRRKGSSP